MKLILLPALLLATLAAGQPADPVKPNVVVLVVDDLGYGDVSCLMFCAASSAIRAAAAAR